MKKFLFSGICVLAIVTVAVLNIKIDLGSQSSTLSLFSLANIDALAGGETDVSGSRTPDYSWTSDEETHWEDGCVLLQPIIAISVVLVLIVTDVIRVLLR